MNYKHFHWCLAIFIFLFTIGVCCIFFVKFNINQTTQLIVDNETMYLVVNNNKYHFISNKTSKTVYHITNPITNKTEKCFLVYYQKVNNQNYYYCNLSNQEIFNNGLYYVNFDYGTANFFEYLIYFK